MIAVVFATMNRANVAAECLRRLSRMTVKPDLIAVSDNNSSDGTSELLEKVARECELTLHLSKLAQNKGNAGGVQLSLRAAHTLGAKWFWIIDDDSWPHPKALEELLSNQPVDAKICSSLIISPGDNNLSWPIEIREITKNSGWRTIKTQTMLTCKHWVYIRRSWLGCFLSREAYETIGEVRGEFFLRGEDEDYPRRMEDSGYSVYLSPKSILEHPPIGPIFSIPFFGRRVMLERNLDEQKLFYRLRNSLIITKERSGIGAMYFHAFGYVLLIARTKIGFWRAFHILWIAFRDALHLRTGIRLINNKARG